MPPRRIFASRSQFILGFGTLCGTANCFLPLYYIPNYFQFVHGDTALMAAVRLLPFIIVQIGTNMTTGFFLPKIRI